MTAFEIIERLNKVKAVKGGWIAQCPAHEDKSPSLSVSVGTENRILLKCHAGCTTAQICEALGVKLADLFEKQDPTSAKTSAKPASRLAAVYPYTDEIGNPLFEVCRFEPKDFRQRRIVNGQTVWGRGDARLVLYRLPEVVKAKTVWVVEGEKDADSLNAIGVVATCNSGGAGKWIDGYTESLRGKHIVICGDNDEPGKKHAELVLESLAGKVESVTVVTVPAGKDISECLGSYSEIEQKKSCISKMLSSAPIFTNGIAIPIQSIQEIENEYIKFLDETKDNCLSLGAWLPSFNYYRPIAPGELVTVIADTGQGKTALLQNVAVCAMPNPVLMFEIELPAPIMFERFAAIDNDAPQSRIESEYRENMRANLARLSHIYTCSVSQLTVSDIERYIVQSEMKIGRKPVVVMIDYIGLLQGAGNRYERLSDAAERLKVIAKKTKTIIVVSSQIHRKGDDSAEEIFLHDAKDSGAIENSSQVVLGMWRNSEDTSGETLTVKVLKYTRGKAGKKIVCNFSGATMKITERARACVYPNAEDA